MKKMRRTTRSSAASNPPSLVNPALFSNLTFTLTNLAAKDAKAAEVQQLIREGGGKLATSVVKNLQYLLAVPADALKPTAKWKTARDRADVKIVSLQFVLDCVQEGKILDGEAYCVTSQIKDDGNQKGAKESEGDAMALDEPVHESKGTRKRKKADINEEEAAAVQPPAVKMVKAVKKGRAAVDHLCPCAERCHVYEDETGIYDAMLNQTDIKNNNNKFYIIQVLEEDSGSNCYLWTRWGRVGAKGQNKLEPLSKETAIAGFCAKFKEKTKNNWSDRANFSKVPGKYFLLDRDFGEDGEDDVQLPGPTDEKREIPDSTLPEPVQRLIQLIFNVDMMTRAMVEIGYDAKKMPLGKLSKANIRKGYDVLAQISAELNTASPSRSTLSDLSSLFYTIIPHEFGMTRPPVIDNAPMLKAKLDMVEALADIEIAQSIIKSTANMLDKNIHDIHYESLKTELVPVPSGTEAFDIVKDYMNKTHAETHRNYELEIEDLFEVHRQGEAERFQKLHNRQLLWHGSRLTNYVGILSQGLQIAPPNAPVTGYMFGKGIYFANMVSKSGNYCYTSRSSSTGILLLCEVALGDSLPLKTADYEAAEAARRANCHSTHGVGRTQPNPAEFASLPTDKDVIVPCGQGIDSKAAGLSLLYDEFIVYNINQVRIRYLVRTKFRHKY